MRETDAFVEEVLRSEVWRRSDGVCHICGEAADETRWHVDHIVPIARGGEHSYANTAVSHPACNLRKGVQVIPDREPEAI